MSIFAKEYLGIDVGEKTIKFVLAQHTNKTKTLKDFYICDIPQGIENPDEYIVNKIAGVVKEKNWAKKKINLILTSKEIVQRGIKIPEIPANELEIVVSREVKRLYSDTKDKKIAFQIMGKQESEGNKLHSVFFTLVPEAMVEGIADFKVKIESLDFKVFALDRLYRPIIDEKENVAIMDIGYSNIILMIYKKKSLEVYREINIAGEEITKTIANVMQIPEDEAEQLKIKYGIVSKEETLKLIESGEPRANQLNYAYQMVMDKILRKLTHSIDYFKTQNRGEEVTKVFLCGGGSNLKNIEHFLMEELGNVMVSFYTGLDKYEIKNNLEGFVQNASKLTAAMGAALIGGKVLKVDKKKEEKIKDKSKNKIDTKTAAMGISAIVPFILAFGLAKLDVASYENKYKEITKKQIEIASLVERYDKAQERITNLEAAKSTLAELEKGKRAYSDVFYDLSEFTVDNIYFTNLSIEGEAGNVSITGNSVSKDSYPEIHINEFLHDLEDRYTEVHLKGTRKATSEQLSAATFDISFKANGGEKVGENR